MNELNNEIKKNTPDSSGPNPMIASPEGALSFLFAIFALLMWFVSIDHSYNLATLMAIGFTWLILSIGALIASLVNIIRGSSRGNANLLVTILLGFFPGINTMISVLSGIAGTHYNPSMVGLMYIIGAVFVIGSAIPLLKKPFYIFLRTLSVGIGLLFVGWGDLANQDVLLAIGGWSLFVFALLSFYYGLSVLYLALGSHLPQGRSFSDHWRRRK